MASSSDVLHKIFSLLIVTAVVISPDAVDAGGGEHRFGWVPATRPSAGGCGGGSVAECLANGGEFSLDQESGAVTNRRILATSQYISYGALQRNTVPCSQRGASYYNCQTGAQANPYNRGCSTITRCRS
ncbi:rapid alkalinization factor-like [Malania oleifera]|uniref:rapid alkalinization factor-like n=1 Tax=Malania oleifera TaxID=397392 RepID=UPI0025AE6A99|nr:rapid alkalinization factor-like [Malania oleifera]